MFRHRAGAALLLSLAASAAATAAPRDQQTVDGGWRSILIETSGAVDPSAKAPADADPRWRSVVMPSNWQGYAFVRQVTKGSRHGTAWYRTRLKIASPRRDERLSLMFEGVNAYATVWLNGKPVGRHAGGLTSFTLDVTDAAVAGDNDLTVRVDLPAGITDLPWVNGGDQAINGFSEGSQPLGIFRPVHLIRTAALRIRPFGFYAWGAKGGVTTDHADLQTRVEVENASSRSRRFTVVTEMIDARGRVVGTARGDAVLAAGANATIERPMSRIDRPSLWHPDHPALYTLRTRILADGRVLDEDATPYGIRSVEVATAADGTRRLLVNGKPFFLRGTSEYEHLLGRSQAFTAGDVATRVEQVKQAGFNAFRDGHYPHNLRYQDKLAKDGLMWWPQFSSHIWFDNPAFRANFKARIADWVRERRNNPALFMWGVQNESVLPADFAREVSDVIRSLDPTATVERLIVTCNGGEGTDWNVPQNWSGTYGGNPAKFGEELTKQSLVGEYGAWRVGDWHAEAPFKATDYSENRSDALLGQKARLADTVADRSVGSFQWLLGTHENPGRPMRSDGTQIWDALSPLNHIGPINNKGLLTLWGEPLDGYYMYRALQVPATKAPVVYLVSHSWPDRWKGPGVRSGIEAYSNCDAVRLFNDVGGRVALGDGRRVAPGLFRWDGVMVRYATLSARCVVGGVERASDRIQLLNLPAAPDAASLTRDPAPITRGEAGRTYLYRIDAGGSGHVDAAGVRWQGDRAWKPGASWGVTSWSQAFAGLDPRLASRRSTSDVIEGTDDQTLFRGFRYGRDELRYVFAAPPGRYRIDLYFVEPWYGRTGIDATGWRVFDVGVNGRTVIRDLDIFHEVGFEHALRRTVEAESVDGRIEIGFPRVTSGQAIISGIAISAAGPVTVPDAPKGSDLLVPSSATAVRSYLAAGDPVYGDARGMWTGLLEPLLDADAVMPERPDAGGTREVAIGEASILWLALPTATRAPVGWADTALTAGISAVTADRTTIEPVRFVTRKAMAGERIAVPAALPLLAQRDLPVNTTAEAFKLGGGGQPGVKVQQQAETARITGGRVDQSIPGFEGSGYARLDKGGSVNWQATTGIQGTLRVTAQYQLRTAAGGTVRLTVRDVSGIVVGEQTATVRPGDSWRTMVLETPTAINAGRYDVTLQWLGDGVIALDWVGT